MSAIVSPSNIADQIGVYVFPASSSDGIGKVLSESNIRDIPGKITTRNYKMSSADFVLSTDNNKLGITKGIGLINGYRVVIPNDMSVDLRASDFEDGTSVKYNVNLKIAKESSTSGYIADTSDTSDYGVIYIEFDTADDSPETIKEYYDSLGLENDKYKPSEQRLSEMTDIVNASSLLTFGNYDVVDMDLSINNEDYTSLGWLINKYNALYVSNIGYDENEIKVNVLDLNKSETSFQQPTLTLTLGYVVLTVSSGSLTIDGVETYDCTKRIDIDEIFCGNQSLSDYLLDNNKFLKPYGANIISSVRTPESGTTGVITQIPYIGTIDSLFTSVTTNDGNDDITIYDKEFMYTPVTYMGETYNEVDSTPVSNTQLTKSIIECSFNSVEHTSQSGNETAGEEVFGAKILNVSGYTNCYTSYGYNLIHRDYGYVLVPSDATYDSDLTYYTYDDGTGEYEEYTGGSSSFDPANNDYYVQDFASKACKLNEYFIGINYDDSYLYNLDDNSGERVAPPFGLFNKDKTATILIKNIIENSTSKYIAEILASKVVLSTPTMYNTSNSTYYAFEVDDNDVSYNMYEVNNGTVTKSSAGFKTVNDNNVAKPGLVFTKGANSSSVYLSEETDTDQNTPVIEFEDNVKVNGYVRATRVYNAVYNDYAEWYNSSNAKNITAGDIIYYNPEKDEYDNKYKSSKTVVGICSEDYGFIVGGEDVAPEINRKKYIPVSLCGRVPVKVNDTSEFKSGDFIYANGSNIGTGIGVDRDRIGKFIKAIDNTTALVQVYLG